MNDAADAEILRTILDDYDDESKSNVEHTGKYISINKVTANKVVKKFLGELPVKIDKGSRWKTSRSYAGLLWACGYPEDDIKKELKKFDKDRNNPPKNNTEDIDKILKFIVTRPQGFRERKRGTPHTTGFTNEILAEAKEIYQSGKFIDYCEKAFGKVWYGDLHILRGVLYMEAVARVANSVFGIHLHVSGDTQTGKSQSIKKALKFLHPNDWMSKSFSLKYLFYAPPGTLHRNTVVFSDDTVFDDETARFFRGILTSWLEGSDRGVVVNHEGKDLSIPPRVSIILTSIEDVCQETDEGQDESRFLTLEIRRTKEQITAIKKFVQEPTADISHDLAVIHAVWTMIPETIVTRHKQVENDLTMREFHRYLELVPAHALLCNRTTTTDEDYSAVEKFLSYSKRMVNSTTAPLTRKESAVLCCLTEEKKTVADIVKETGMSIQDVYRAVRGRNGTFQNPKGGLMKKEPKLQYKRRSSKDENDVHLFGVG